MNRQFSCIFLIVSVFFKYCHCFVEVDADSSACVNNLILGNLKDSAGTICIINADFHSDHFVQLHYTSKTIVYFNHRQPIIDIFVVPLPFENQRSYIQATEKWLTRLSDFNSNAVWIFVTEKVEATLLGVIVKQFMRKVVVVNPTNGMITGYKFFASEEIKPKQPEEFGMGNCRDQSVEFQFESPPELWRNSTLQVAVFPFEPYVDVAHNVVVGGIEYELLKIVEKKLQFSMHFELKAVESRGKKHSTPDGITYNNILGFLWKRSGHVAIGCFHHSYEMHLHFDVTHFIMQDHYHYIVPRALPVHRWKAVLTTLQPLTWISITATLVILSLLWSIFKRQNLISTNLFFFQLLLENANNKIITENRIAWRILISSVLLPFLAISNVFKSEMVRVLTVQAYETQIDSLKDIIEHTISIKAFHDFGEIYAHSDSDYSEHLVYKYCNDKSAKICANTCLDNKYCLDQTALNRDSATVLMKRYYKYYLPKRYLDEEGYPRVHLIEKAILPIYVHLFFTRGFPMYLQIRSIISRARDCGLVAHLTDKVSYMADKAMKLKNHIESHNLDYDTISFAFFLWFAGAGLSMGVWFLELWRGRRNHVLKRKPNSH